MASDLFLFLSLDISASVFTYTDYILIGIIILLILVNIFVSGSEVAFFSLDSNDLDTLKSTVSSSKAHLLGALTNSDQLLASILIAYNVINVAIIALFVHLLRKIPFFTNFGFSLMLLLIGIAIILILVIEILPKLYASNNPLKVVRRNIKGVVLIDAIVSPLSSFLVRFTNVFTQRFAHRKHEISIDDLSKALELTSSEASYEQEKDMLEGIIRFRQKSVSDILISRADMFSLSFNNSFKVVISFIVDAGFSRIPVYEDNEDEIRGILYVKDLLPHLGKSDSFNWQTLIRPAYFVPENKHIDELLEEFRTNKNHMVPYPIL